MKTFVFFVDFHLLDIFYILWYTTNILYDDVSFSYIRIAVFAYIQQMSGKEE